MRLGEEQSCDSFRERNLDSQQSTQTLPGLRGWQSGGQRHLSETPEGALHSGSPYVPSRVAGKPHLARQLRTLPHSLAASGTGAPPTHSRPGLYLMGQQSRGHMSFYKAGSASPTWRSCLVGLLGPSLPLPSACWESPGSGHQGWVGSPAVPKIV